MGEQGLALFDRPPHRGASRIVVVRNHRLIALIGIPVNVTLVMIQYQHRPVLTMRLPLAADLLLPGLKPHHSLAPPIRVGSGVDRIFQHAEHRMVSSGLPDDLVQRFWPQLTLAQTLL